MLALALGVAAIRSFPEGLWLVLAIAFVAGADFFTWGIFGYSCSGVVENPSEEWLEACDAYPEGLPLIGLAAAIAGGMGARIARSWWPLAAGLIIGAGAGLFPWIVYGDPAGNWEGLFF